LATTKIVCSSRAPSSWASTSIDDDHRDGDSSPGRVDPEQWARGRGSTIGWLDGPRFEWRVARFRRSVDWERVDRRRARRIAASNDTLVATDPSDEVAPMGLVAGLPAHSVARLDLRAALCRTARRIEVLQSLRRKRLNWPPIGVHERDPAIILKNARNIEGEPNRQTGVPLLGPVPSGANSKNVAGRP
jgi:hypothetical protein